MDMIEMMYPTTDAERLVAPDIKEREPRKNRTDRGALYSQRLFTNRDQARRVLRQSKATLGSEYSARVYARSIRADGVVWSRWALIVRKIVDE